MALNTNLWDIVKSIAVIILLIFLWTEGSSFIDKFNKSPDIPPAVLIQLDENKMMLQNLRANSEAAKVLIEEIKTERGQQAQLLKYVEEENKKKDAKIEELGVIVAKLERTVEKQRSAATVVKKPLKTGDVEEDSRREELKYEFKKIYAKDAKNEDFPIGWAMYFPNKSEEEHWKTGTYPLEFNATIVESETEQGTYDRAVELHIENNTNQETIGKEFPIKVSELRWEKFERKEKKMYWWNPRLGFGGMFTSEDIAPKIDLSLSSYGRTKRDMDWRFFTFGIGAAKNDGDDGDWKIIGSVEPFSWNMGNILPLIENLFVGPIVTYDSDNEVAFGASISIPF